MKKTSIADLDLSDPNNPKVVHLNMGLVKQFFQDFGKSVRITVTYETYRRKRTVEQNSLFHVYCLEIADDTGQDFDDVKSTLKMLYARKPLLDKDGNEQFNEKTGELLEYVQDTSKMDTVEMGKLIDNTVMFALDFFGIVLAPAGESKELKFKNIK